MNSHSSSLHSTALVLGGGGSAGNAWELGVIAGLADAGLDVTTADLIVGTSAGSTVAAQVTAASSAVLFSQIVDTPIPTPTARPRPVTDGAAVGDQLRRTGDIIAAATDAADMRRRMGESALEQASASGDAGGAAWRSIVASRLPGHDWPDQRLVITAVDARTGALVEFDRHSGVDLVDAVAASCSSGTAYRIGDRFYIDGGYRRNENADLATGYDRVIVLLPFSGRTRHPLAWGLQLDA